MHEIWFHMVESVGQIIKSTLTNETLCDSTNSKKKNWKNRLKKYIELDYLIISVYADSNNY